MKKIISTEGLLNGKFDAPWTNAAIHERIDNRLAYLYKLHFEEDIQATPAFTYELADGQATALELSYTVESPTRQRLENFRDICDDFYELRGFVAETVNGTPRVYFRATDMFDMGSLIHALAHLTVCLESIICAVDAGLTEKDAIYSPDESHILQIPDVPHYRIKEGTSYISPMAARHCTRLKMLDIPAGMLFDDSSLREYPQGLKVAVWDTHYDGTPYEEDEVPEITDDDLPVYDQHGVGYSRDGKTLRCCRGTFIAPRYEVPDGVQEIADFAFLLCPHFLEVSIPRSVRTIGDCIFGSGGCVIIRED